MIHGAAIYGDMDPINIPPLCEHIYHTWSLWEMAGSGFLTFFLVASVDDGTVPDVFDFSRRFCQNSGFGRSTLGSRHGVSMVMGPWTVYALSYAFFMLFRGPTRHVTFSKWAIQSLHLGASKKGRNMVQCSARPCELRPPEFHFLYIPHLS